MPVQARPKTAIYDSSRYQGLSRGDLLRIYRTMFLSRRIDDREIQLKRQNKTFFQISGAGHEGVLAAAGLILRPGHDWVYPYYRDRALCLALGVTPLEMFLQAVGAKDDPNSGGRQMPSHWGIPRLNILPRSSSTGMQYPHAVGMAEAALYFGKFPQALQQAQQAPLGEHVRHQADEIVYVSGGDGSTSEGEFFEALNSACLRKLPILFLIEDNGWAISVPVQFQTAGGNISKLVANYPGLFLEECDGSDPLASSRGPSARLGILPGAKGTGARARAGHASLFAFAFRRRKTLQIQFVSGRRSASRPHSKVWTIFGARGDRR